MEGRRNHKKKGGEQSAHRLFRSNELAQTWLIIKPTILTMQTTLAKAVIFNSIGFSPKV
jgi:hypothetical protein